MTKGQRNPKGFINPITGRKQIDWTLEQFESIVTKIPSVRDRAYISFMYITGCRKCEPLDHIKKKRILEEFKGPDGHIIKKWNGKIESIHVPAFTVGQIMKVNRMDKRSNKMTPFIDFQNLHTAKRRKKDYRETVRTIPVNALLYRKFLIYIFQYIKNLNLKRSSKLFDFGYKTGQRIVDKRLGTPVHYLRHLRNTHLRILHNYDGIDLVRFNGWTDERPANTYLHINPLQLAEKQM